MWQVDSARKIALPWKFSVGIHFQSLPCLQLTSVTTSLLLDPKEDVERAVCVLECHGVVLVWVPHSRVVGRGCCCGPPVIHQWAGTWEPDWLLCAKCQVF